MLQKIPYTTRRSGVFYVQFWCDNQLIKTSLRTDSPRKARSIMHRLSPLVADCINGKISVEGLKKIVRGLIGLKDEEELIDDYARSETILAFNKRLNEYNHSIITGIPFPAEEVIQEFANLAAALDDPLTAYKLQSGFIELYLKKTKNISAIEQGLKTEEQITKEATRQWQTYRDMLRIQSNTLSFQDKNIESLLTKHITQADRAYNKLTTSSWEKAESNSASDDEQIKQQKMLLLSDLHQEHREKKTASHANALGKKPNELTSDDMEHIRRQNKYFMKFKAVAGDIDILSTSRVYIFDSLEKLFDWPNESQKGSRFSAITKENKDKAKTQEWYDSIAAELEDIALDDTIEKSKGTVKETRGWLQELYKFAIDREYAAVSPVINPTSTFRKRERAAKAERVGYSEVEIRKVLEYVTKENHRAKWAIILMCYTGCRNSELYGITKADIDLQKKSIYIKGTKTEAATRHIPLSYKLKDKGFLEFIEDKDNSTPILKGTIPEQQLSQAWREITETLNIQEITSSSDDKKLKFRSFYSLRKSVRTYATNSGVAEDIIEICIGHKVAGSAMKKVYQDTALLSGNLEAMRPIFDELPW